ncbi:unnamed protein product [Prorocentrum cordatum]|uniref:Uncharacterized protein n=1 Tax=Prorocentrum cordatum TaxID=2364126 RepID=A0ABN9WRV7_9DINO|nr:unnamed protein product [Polarella glacialis]
MPFTRVVAVVPLLIFLGQGATSDEPTGHQACEATGESEHAALVQLKKPEAGGAAATQTAAHTAPTSLLARFDVCPGRGCAQACEESDYTGSRGEYFGRFQCRNDECLCLVSVSFEPFGQFDKQGRRVALSYSEVHVLVTSLRTEGGPPK